MLNSDFQIRLAGTCYLNDKDVQNLTELIEELREEGLDGEIAYRPPTGRGLTLLEITSIYVGGKALDAVTGHVIDAVLDAVARRTSKWAKTRYGKSRRGQLVKIYGPNNEILLEVQVDKDSSKLDLSKGGN